MSLEIKGDKNDYKTGSTKTRRLRGNGLNSDTDLFFENRIEREWLTTVEAALFLSISPNALRIMVHRGRVPVYKFGRRLRFRLSDCRALFERKGA